MFSVEDDICLFMTLRRKSPFFKKKNPVYFSDICDNLVLTAVTSYAPCWIWSYQGLIKSVILIMWPDLQFLHFIKNDQGRNFHSCSWPAFCQPKRLQRKNPRGARPSTSAKNAPASTTKTRSKNNRKFLISWCGMILKYLTLFVFKLSIKIQFLLSSRYMYSNTIQSYSTLFSPNIGA